MRYPVGASAEYSPEIEGLGKLLVRADFYHSDTFYLNERPPEDTAAIARGYEVVNARAGVLNVAGSGLDVTAFADNLFNRTYVAGAGNVAPALTFIAAIYGPLRLYGVELRYHF